jgi:hypothetical protein
MPLRSRAHERRVAITGAAIDETAGLPRYYIAKLLAVHPVKRIGAISLGPVLSVLGVRLLLVEDEQSLQTYAARIPQRRESSVHAGTIEIKFSRKKFREIQAKGRRARWDAMTAKQRSAYARRMNRARWQREAANGGAAHE